MKSVVIYVGQEKTRGLIVRRITRLQSVALFRRCHIEPKVVKTGLNWGKSVTLLLNIRFQYVLDHRESHRFTNNSPHYVRPEPKCTEEGSYKVPNLSLFGATLVQICYSPLHTQRNGGK